MGIRHGCLAHSGTIHLLLRRCAILECGLLLLLKLLLPVCLLALEQLGFSLDGLEDVARLDELRVCLGNTALLHLLVFLLRMWVSAMVLLVCAYGLGAASYLVYLLNMFLGHARRQYALLAHSIAAATLLRHSLVGLHCGHDVRLQLPEHFSVVGGVALEGTGRAPNM